MNKTTRYSKRLKGEPPECGLYSIQCSICLECKHNEFFNNNPYCKHNICSMCLDEWLEVRKETECPTCKESLVNNVYLPVYDDKLYPPLYFYYEPPPRWLVNTLIFLFKCINKVVWYNADSDDEQKEEEITNELDRLNRLEVSLE